MSGLLSGYVYLNDLLGVQRLRLPPAVGALFSPLCFLFGPTAASALPNSATPAPPGGGRRQGQQRRGNARDEDFFGGAGGGFQRQQHHPMPPPPPAPEEAIETLMNLGFERDRVIRALQSRDNNLEAAANFLLSGND